MHLNAASLRGGEVLTFDCDSWLAGVSYPDGQNREQWLSLLEGRRNPFYEFPDRKNVQIWRYMSFEKYVSFLSNEGLFFSRASSLGDPFEGSVSNKNVNRRTSDIQSRISFMLAEAEKGNWDKKSIDDGIRQIENMAVHYPEMYNKFSLDWTFVNCWHVGDVESAAMWSIYSSNRNSIVLRSRFSRIYDVFRKFFRPPLGYPKIGLVKYVDYEAREINESVVLSRFFFKRLSFSHEKEMRLIFDIAPVRPLKGQRFEDGDVIVQPPGSISFDAPVIPGCVLKFPIENLVDEVVISPTADPWFSRMVADVTKRLGFSFTVRSSDMNLSPIF